MINTLDSLKLLLGITGTEQDELLQLELELTEDFITEYTHNYFFVNNIYVKQANLIFDETLKTIETQQTDLTQLGFAKGQQIRIIGSNLNDSITTITNIIGNIFYVDNVLENEENLLTILIQAIKYPKSLKLIQAEMVKFNLLTAEKTGIKQESISRHSITYGTDTTNAYPDFIIKKLNAYNNVSF